MDESSDLLQSTLHLATNSTTTPTEEMEQDVNLNIPKMNYYFHHHTIQHSLFYWINNENTLNEMCNTSSNSAPQYTNQMNNNNNCNTYNYNDCGLTLQTQNPSAGIPTYNIYPNNSNPNQEKVNEDYIAFDEDETNLTKLRIDDIQEENKIQINGLDDNDYESTLTTDDATITGDEFDDLEFLHDFLEHENKRPFFESIFFKINCKNRSILGILLTLLGCLFYLLYYYFGNSYIDNHYKELIPVICIVFTFWPTECFPTKYSQFQSGAFKSYLLGLRYCSNESVNCLYIVSKNIITQNINCNKNTMGYVET